MNRTLGQHHNFFRSLATVSLAALACSGAVIVGCGSSSSSSAGPQDSGPVDTGVVDSGHDASTMDANDSGVIDTGVADVVTEPIEQTLVSPTFTPVDGTTFTNSGSVVIHGPLGFPNNGTLYYTLDGTIPTHTGLSYVGPIQVAASETIFAIASAPGYQDSPPVHASYIVVAGEEGPVKDPVIVPSSTKASNDFMASITDSDSTLTICYRLDGSLPTCTPAGQCSTGSSTYNGGSQISINGALTPLVNPPTGAVTVTAIACDSKGNVADCNGGPNGVGCEADYVLEVADPFMTNPPQGTDLQSGGTVNATWGSAVLPSGNTGLTPSLATNTESTNKPVQIWYSASGPGKGPVASCITGTQGTNPTLFNSATGQATIISGSTEVSAIGCKQGYKPSNPTTFTYNLGLATPTLPLGGTYSFQPQLSAPGFGPTGGLTVTDTANAGSNDFLCYTSGAVPTPAATCGANGGCGTGSTQLSAPPAHAALAVGNTTSPSTVVSVIACPPPGVVLSSPAAVSQTYTLRYAQLFASSTDPFGTDQNLPGWGDLANGNGVPTTTFSLPSGAGSANGYPVSDTCAAAGTFDVNGKCMWQIGIVEPLPGCVGKEFNCPGTAGPLNLNPAYFCWSSQRGKGSLACGTAANTCKSGTTLTFTATPPAPDNLVDGTGAAVGALSVQGGANPDTLSLLACPDVVSTNIVVVEQSFQTDVGPAGKAGGATAPQASPSGGAQTAQAVVSVTQEDPTASIICFTTDGTAPGCTFAAGVASCTGTTTYCGQNTLPAATAPAAPVLASGGTCNTGVNAATSAIPFGSSITVPAVTDGSTGLFLQVNQSPGDTLRAVACNGVESTSPPAVTTPYTFSLAVPDFGSKPQVSAATCAGQTASCAGTSDLDVPSGVVGVGTPVYLTDTSNFNWEIPSNAAISVHWAWGGMANCGTVTGACPGGTLNGLCGTTIPSSYTQNKSGGVYAIWGGPNAITNVPAPATGNTVTLSAVACGENTNLQVNSTEQVVTFTVAAATPLLLTDQSCLTLGNAAKCSKATINDTCTVTHTAGAWNAPANAQAAVTASLTGVGACPPATGASPTVSNWNNGVQLLIVGATPGTVAAPSYLCASTNGQPSCTSAAGCSPSSTYKVTDTGSNGNVTPVITIDGKAALSGTTVYAAACTGTLPEVDMVPVTFNLTSSALDFVDPAAPANALPSGSTVVCGVSNTGMTVGTSVNSVQIQQDAANATYQSGGPTANECFCYTQDGSAVNTAGCSASTTGCAGATGPASGTTKCVPMVNGVSTWDLSIDGPAAINWSSCVAGAAYNASQSSGANSYKAAPYAHTITVDGDTKEWYLSGQDNIGGPTNFVQPESFQATAGGGTAMLSYDATNLYLGFLNATFATGAYTPAAGIAFGGATNPAVGILIGNGASSSATAPQALPTAAGFSTTPGITLQQTEGALYFVVWPTGGTTTTVYQWTAGAWAVASGVTPAIATGVDSGLSGGHPDFEMSIPFASLPLLSSASTELTVQGIYVTGLSTGTVTQQFTWAAFPPPAVTAPDDGWFNAFTNSCVAPAFLDTSAPATISANPGK